MSDAPRVRPVQLAAAAVGVVMVLLVVLLVTRKAQTNDDTTGPSVVGEQAPALDGKALIGEKFDIGTNDRWLLVNFFATWCIPCVEEHDDLKAFSEEHEDDGLARVVSVVYDEGDRAARQTKQFFDKRGGDWTVLDSDDGRTALDWRVAKVPESFLVSPQGEVVQRFVGGVTKRSLDATIDALEKERGRTEGSSDDGGGGS